MQMVLEGKGDIFSSKFFRCLQIDELRRLLGPLPEKLSIYCSDASIARYLRARNWNVKKATKMIKKDVEVEIGIQARRD